jgi:hypothetical protein
MACGVFGNIGVDDVRGTIAALPALLAAGGIVIWTRGRPDEGSDPSMEIRACFDEHGFEEMAFTRPADARFRVGMHRLSAGSATDLQSLSGVRLFTFA